MKNTIRIIVALMLVLCLALPFVACTSDETADDDTTTTTTTTKLTTLGSSDEKPDNGNNDNNNDNTDDGNGDDTDDGYIELTSGDEQNAQDAKLGQLVYWNDQNWCGSTVSVLDASANKGVYTFEFTHTGECWYGFQLFYNPEDTVNGSVYNVSFKITPSVDAIITAGGTIVNLTANEEKTVEYQVTADMIPTATDYQYGQSVFDVQFGADGVSDIVDGTYVISDITVTVQE